MKITNLVGIINALKDLDEKASKAKDTYHSELEYRKGIETIIKVLEQIQKQEEAP